MNNCPLIVNGLAALIVTPFMLRYLGTEGLGFWTAMLTVLSIFSLFDTGIAWGVTRVVATDRRDRETDALVASASVFYVLFGVLGCAAFALLGPIVGSYLHLQAGANSSVRSLFTAAGLAFSGEQVTTFASALLRGNRRFRVLAVFLSMASCAKAGGILVLVATGAGLTSLMSWYAAVAILSGLIGTLVATHTGSTLSFHLARPGFAVLRREFRYCILSRLNDVVSMAIWQGPLLLIAMVTGTAGVAVYSIGQRFPATSAAAAWRASEVFFPAASHYQERNEESSLRHALILSTRWMLIFSIPLCLIFSIFAPELLRAWLGTVPPGSVEVLRITAIAVSLGAIGNGADNLLWGQGKAQAVVGVGMLVGLVNLGLGYLLLIRWGVVGAAVAFVIAWAMSSLLYLQIESRSRSLRLVVLVRDAARGLLWPVLACCSIMVMVKVLCAPIPTLVVGLGTVCGATSFTLTLYALNKEDRLIAAVIVRKALGRSRAVLAPRRNEAPVCD